MPSKIYRDRIINQIEYAVREAENAIAIEHPGLLGRIRELSASHVFGPLLPLGFEIGTGKICDREGHLSCETDLIIYNKSILPPVMYSEREGVFPIEACFYAIEVKSKATASEVRDAIQKGKEIMKLEYAKPSSSGESRNLSLVVPTLFAFDSDLSESGMSELQRYAKYDPEWKDDPVLKAICVARKGYWYHSPEDSCWFFHPPTPAHDEVIDLVSGVVNTLTKARTQVREALLGQYLMLARTVIPVRE
jgi:hypothetical protein